MNNEIKTEIETVEKWLEEVSKNNNHEIDQTYNLKIVLFNLKIICANVKEIKPIARELENIIDEMHSNTLRMVNEGRVELRKSFSKIKDYILSQE
jgi:hypothetical protein